MEQSANVFNERGNIKLVAWKRCKEILSYEEKCLCLLPVKCLSSVTFAANSCNTVACANFDRKLSKTLLQNYAFFMKTYRHLTCANSIHVPIV